MTINIVPNPNTTEPQNLGTEASPWSSAHADNVHTGYIRLFSFNEPLIGLPQGVIDLQNQYSADAEGGPVGIPEWTNILHMRQSGLYVGSARVVMSSEVDVVNSKLDAFFGRQDFVHLGLSSHYPHLEDGWDSLVEIISRIKGLHTLASSVPALETRISSLEAAFADAGIGSDVVDLEDLSDVSITSPQNGDVLAYSSGSWVNAPVNLDTSALESRISALEDAEPPVTNIFGGTLISVTGSTVSFSGDLSGFLTSADVAEYVTASDLSVYATAATLSNYAPAAHEHTEYALAATLSNYALVDHVHSEYASVDHTHSEYITAGTLAQELASYATSATLSNYVTSTGLTSTLGGYVTDAELATAISDRATVAELSSVVTTLTSSINANATAISSEETRATQAESALETRLTALEIEDTTMEIAGISVDHGGSIGASTLASAVGVVKTLEALGDTDFTSSDLQLGDLLQYKEQGWAVSDVYIQPGSAQSTDYTLLGTNAFNYLSNSATAIQKRYEAVWVYVTEITNEFWCPDATGENDYFKLDMRALQKDMVTLVPATGSGDSIAPASTPSALTTELVLLSDIYYFWSEDGSTWLYSTTGFPSSQTSTVPALVPRVDLGVDLGSPTLRFRDLHLSGNTVFLGGTAISIDESGALTDPNGDTYIVASELSAATLALNTRITSEVSTLSSQIGSSISAATLALNTRITAEVDTLSARASDIEQNVAQIVSNTDPAALDSLTELVAAFQGADSDLSAAITAALGTHTSELNVEVTRAQAAEDALGTRIDATESAIAAATLSISSAVTRLDGHDLDIATLTGDVSTLETQAATITGRIDAHDVTLGTLSTTVAALSTNLDTVNSTVTTHTNDISTINGTLATLDTAITANSNSIGALQTSVSVLNTQVTANSNSIGTINGTLATLDTAITANSNSIGTINGTLASLDSVITANSNSIGSLQTELDATQLGAGLGTDGAYTANTLTNYIDSATSLFNADTLLDQQLHTVTTDLSSLQTQVETIQSGNSDDVSALQGEIDATQTGAGLGTGGAYTANSNASYIGSASSLKNADDLLDAAIATKQDTLTAGSDIIITASSTISVGPDVVRSADISNFASVTYVDNAVAGLVDSAPATLDTLNELAAALGDDPNFATTVTNSIGVIRAIVDARQDIKAFSTDLHLTSAGTLGLVHDYATTSALGTLDATVSTLSGTVTTLSTTVSEREHIVDLSDDFTLSTAGTLSLSNVYALSADVTTLSSTVSGINTRVTTLEGTALTAASTLSASKLDHNTITLAGQSVVLGGSVSAATLSAAISSDMAVDLGISELATAATLSNYVTASSLTTNYHTSSQVDALLAAKQDTLSTDGPLSIADDTLSIDLSDYVTSATLASWSGSSALTTLGTISAGTWQGAQIADGYIASANTWNAKQDAISAGTHIAISGTSVAVAPELISAVEANTAKTGITTEQASAITTNTAKVGFTDALARNALSAGGDLSYNSTTGEMSYSSAWSVSGSVASTDAQITVSGHVLEVFDMGADMVSSPSMTLDAGSLTSLLSRQVDMGTLNQERLF